MRLYVAGSIDAGEGFDLQLGEDFLRNFDIEFDLAANAVRLWQPKDCAAASLAYWTRDVVGEVPIKTPTPDSRSGYIELTAKLNGKPVDARLDSGASVSLVSDKVATATVGTKGRTDARVIGTAGKSATVWVSRFSRFDIGNEDIPDVDIAVIEQEYPMLLGADFLRSHRTLVSHSQQKLYFSYTGGPVFVVPGQKPPVETAGDPPKGDQAARGNFDER
jgi:hypothetical protein